MMEITVISSIDNSEEKNLFFYPETTKPCPLLVGLHTWSCNRYNQEKSMLPYCEKNKWALLLPEFRGPNLASNHRAIEACASEKAKQDIIDAVEFIIKRYSIDTKKIMLLGGSGGGHMALMMAGYRPDLWKAVSSWCPITDLRAWHAENKNYAFHIESVCGGKPSDSKQVNDIYKKKSPYTYVEQIAKANVSIHHGRYDTSVPFSHTLNIITMIEKYNPKRLFYEIFDGTHELRYEQAINWLKMQIEKTEFSNTQALTG